MTFNLRVFWGGESAPQACQQYARLLHSSSASWAEHLSLEGVNNMSLKHQARPTWAERLSGVGILQYVPQACRVKQLGRNVVYYFAFLHRHQGLADGGVKLFRYFCLLHCIAKIERHIDTGTEIQKD